MLQVGDTAPDFSLCDQTGQTVSLEDAVSEGPAIVYFYPADFTPICTAEACAFRDEYAGVERLGLKVVGISPQDVASHARFAERHRLPFSLLADPEKRVVRAYGVDGPLGFGVRRATFLVGKDKVVRNRVVSDFFVGSHLALLKETLAQQPDNSED